MKIQILSSICLMVLSAPLLAQNVPNPSLGSLPSLSNPMPPVPQPLPTNQLSNSQNDNESLLLSEVGKTQAQLKLTNLRNKLESSNISMARDRLKFEEEQQEAEIKRAENVASQNEAKGLTADGRVKKSDSSSTTVQPSVRSIYSYNGKWFADIYLGNNKYTVTPGTVVSNIKIVSISQYNVVVLNKGKKDELFVENGSDQNITVQSNSPMNINQINNPASGSRPPLPPTNR